MSEPIGPAAAPVRHMCWECHDIHEDLFICHDCGWRICSGCVDDEYLEREEILGYPGYTLERPLQEAQGFVCNDCADIDGSKLAMRQSPEYRQVLAVLKDKLGDKNATLETKLKRFVQ